MKRFSLLCSFAGLVLPLLTLLTGCGGGTEETPPVAQAPAPTSSRGGPAAMAPNAAGENSEESSSSGGSASYGGEGSGGASYGSEQGAMNGGGMGGMGGMGMGSSGMGGMGMGAPGGKTMGPPSDMMLSKDGEESSGMMSSGYPTGGMGMPDEGESSGMGNPYDMRSMAANAGSKGEGGAMGMPAGYGEMMNSSGMGEGGPMSGTFGPGGFGAAGGSGVNQFISQNCISCHGNLAPKGGISLASLSGDFAADASVWEQVVEQVESDAMPPASAPRRPTAQQGQAFVKMVKEELAKAGVGEGQDYLARAKSAFARGKEEEAINYFYAQALTAPDEDAQTLLKNARWFAAGKRPVTTLRFAVGIVLEAPEGLDVKPIGVSQLASGGSGGGGRPSMGGYGESGGAGNTTKERSFYELTGDFGQALASAFETRWTSGAMGSVFSDVVAATPAVNNANGMGMGMMGMGMGMDEEGRGMSGGRPGMGAAFDGPSGGAPGGTTSNRKAVMAGQSITSGLIYLGTGSQKDLQKKAADQGIDGLFVFDIEATSIRNSGIVTNTTRVRLLLTSGTIISSTKALKNIEVERAKMSGKDGDEVEKNITQLFNKFDSELKLVDMPTPKPEHAKGRLLQLVNDKTADKLQTLFETRLYHSLGALTQDEVATVYQIVLRGNEGITLASGTADDRKLVMKEVLTN